MGLSSSSAGVSVGASPVPEYLRDHEKAIQEALEAGFEVVESNPHTLLLDLDSHEAYSKLDERIALINKLLPWGVIRSNEWRSKSGNWHVVCDLVSGVAADILTRNMLELCLGSDPNRGMFIWKNSLTSAPQKCSVLFKPTEKTRAVASGGIPGWFDSLEQD